MSVNITKKFFVISFFVVLMVFSVFSSLDQKVQASSTDNVTGWAWSSNIGWISLNCTNTNSCGTTGGNVNYGLTIANNGDITGYAWSPNIGWIKFGGFANSSFPNISGDGTSPINANLSGTKITGWARACNGLNDVITNPQINQTVSNGTACTGVPRTDGWDGWISLHNSNDDYGVNVSSSTGAITGFAWGSDVVGWIQFDATTSLAIAAPTLVLTATANGVSGSTLTVSSGDTVTLSAVGSLLNTTAGNGTASYTLDPSGATHWSGSKTCPSTTSLPYTAFTVTNTGSAVATYTYSLSCNNASGAGSTVSNIVTVNVNPPATPSLTMIATTADGGTSVPSGTITIPSGVTFTLSSKGNSLNTATGAGTASGGGSFTGAKTCPASLTVPLIYTSITLTNPTSSPVTHTYTLSCPYASGGGPVVSSVNVIISPAVTPVSLLLRATGNGATGSNITVNSGDTVTLSAIGSGLNTTANAGTSSLGWSGNVTCPSSSSFPTFYTPFILNDTGSTSGNTHTYKLSCPKASDGTAYDSNIVTVFVNPLPPPTVILKAYSDPSFTHQITSPLPSTGGNVYLQWSSTNATSCVSSNLNNPTPLNISGWSGLTQATTGSTGAINITHSTTFVMVCSANGSSDGSMAPVQVGVHDVPRWCPSMGTPPCPKKQPGYIEI